MWQLTILHRDHLKFPRITESMPFPQKSKFEPVVIYSRHVPWFTCGSNILPLCFICPNFWKLAKYSKICWNFSKVFGLVIVDEKTWFGVLNTHISAFLESPRFHLYSFQGLPLWYVCSCGNSPYCIEITWNFPRITESMPFHEKNKFEPVVIYSRDVPMVHLWF